MSPHQIKEGVLPQPPATPEVVETSARSEMFRAQVVAGVGIAITLAGVVLYCVASLSAGGDADLGQILFRGASSNTLIALCIMAIGTLLWMIGSLIHLGCAMGEDEHGHDGA